MLGVLTAVRSARATLVLVAAGLLTSPGFATEAGTATGACRVIPLDPRPAWTVSGAWADEGGTLLVVDVRDGALLAFDVRSGEGRRVTPKGGILSRPTVIDPHGDGFLVKQPPAEFVRLTNDLDVEGSYELRTGSGIGAVLEAAIGDDDHVTALVSLVDGNAVELAFVELRLGPTLTVRRLPVPTVSGDEELLYRLAGPMVARAGGASYALRFRDGAFIEQITGSPRRLDAFPEGFGEVPELPPPRGSANAAEMFAGLERSALPVQILGRGEFLHLLTRRPAGEGGTIWTLHLIDPVEDRLVRSLRLPTRANHLVVVPGEGHWALVEKGRVAAAGEQRIESAVLVPTRWIEDPESRELTTDGRVDCPVSEPSE